MAMYGFVWFWWQHALMRSLVITASLTPHLSLSSTTTVAIEPIHVLYSFLSMSCILYKSIFSL